MPEKKCFLIMPISTPPESVSFYNNDNEHFLHVMKCLFIPAIEEAGFEPVLPITKGSDNIQGHIISNLESADLVFCDMSTQNPNVFFELGIRTALNKPICLVKDSLIEKVPLDTSLINHHKYSHDLTSWIVKQEIKKLAIHIEDSFRKSENRNSIWKYLGFKSTATPPENVNGEPGKIDFLAMQMDTIIKKLDEQSHVARTGYILKETKEDTANRFFQQNDYALTRLQAAQLIEKVVGKNVADPNSIRITLDNRKNSRTIVIRHGGQFEENMITGDLYEIIKAIELAYGVDVAIEK